MKAIIIIFCLFWLSISSFAQRSPVPNRTSVSLEEAGFNKDSINALDDTISDFEQNEVRGIVTFLGKLTTLTKEIVRLESK